MAVITPPKYVKQILKTLQSHGHLAFLVGGCVRDIILGRCPNDWDICTSALPEEVMAVFPASEPTGLAHGTVTVHLASHAVEVTTFRAEAGYADHRHPDAVSFVCDLTTDLKRRDFTMNAIALSPDGLMVDPFGGIGDIENKLVRCVGEPAVRFEEDALRMLRAMRFAARLGFEIEPGTMSAIREKAHLAVFLAPERIREELEKTILTGRPQAVFDIIDAGLLDGYMLRRPSAALNAPQLALLPKNAAVRWTGLAYLLEEYEAADSAGEFLASLRLDSRTVRCASDAVSIMRTGISDDAADMKRLLRDFGADTVTYAAECSDALIGGKCRRTLKSVLRSGECFSVKHLAVTGDDLIAVGLRGRAVGDMLAFLLDYVIEHPENNKREILLDIARGTEES